jgi:hypothetical protein
MNGFCCLNRFQIPLLEADSTHFLLEGGVENSPREAQRTPGKLFNRIFPPRRGGKSGRQAIRRVHAFTLKTDLMDSRIWRPWRYS